MTGPYRDSINRSRRSVVRLLVTIVVVFVASWLPYNVVSLRVDLSLDAGAARGIHRYYSSPEIRNVNCGDRPTEAGLKLKVGIGDGIYWAT